MDHLREYTVVEEPRGATYRGLIGHLGALADSFLLVVRPEVECGPGCARVLRELSADLIETVERTSWPGTKLLSGTARVHRFRSTKRAIALLAETSDGLFEWQQPGLPEDLVMSRAGRPPLLVTIAHEGDAYLHLTDEEVEAVCAEVPGLILTARSDESA